MAVQVTEAGTQARVRERGMLVLLSACIFLTVLNTSMFNVALPEIGRAFGVSPARLGWVVTAYSLVFGIAQPFYGRLGDRYGLRRMFLIGLGVFSGGSLVAMLAPNYLLLIGCRVLQALGTAAVPSLGTALIIRTIPETRRGTALGTITATVGAGGALGPTLGGLITDVVSWRALFLVSALPALVIPIARRVVPASRPTGGSVDVAGGLLLASVIANLLLAVSNLERFGLRSPAVLVPLVFSLLSGVALAWRMRSRTDPFVPPVLLRDRNYLLAGGVAFLQSLAHFGTLVTVPLLLDRVHGLPASQIGLVMLPAAALWSVMSPITGRIADRVGGLPPMRAGLAVWAVGMAALTSVGVGGSPLAVAVLLAVCGTGMGMVGSTGTVIVSGLLPPERVGLGIGLYHMQFFIGSAFGATLTTTVIEVREHASDAWNPLHQGAGAGFSDALLVTLLASLLASFLASRIRLDRPRRQVDRPVQEVVP